MLLISFEHIIAFLTDENLVPIKTLYKKDAYNFQIAINEPWGTNDTKFRCGIISKTDYMIDGNYKQSILFNAFKAKAVLGNEYSGTFFKFVALIKNMSIEQAQHYFIEKYVLPSYNLSTLQQTAISTEHNSYTKTHKQLYITIPDTYQKFDYKIHEQYTNYLLQRGLTLEKISRLKLFINPIEKRIVFPIYENNILIAYTERDITNINPIRWKKNKGSNIHAIWNLENVQGNIVYIFEGIFDAIHFDNGVALLGVGSEQQMKKILRKGFFKIILLFDNDEGGRNARYKWAQWLTAHGHQNVYIFDYSGITEKDFSEIYASNKTINVHNHIIKWNLATEIKFKLKEIL